MLVQMFGDIQHELTESARRDRRNGRRIRSTLKTIACGMMDGVLVNGVIITVIGIKALKSINKD